MTTPDRLQSVSPEQLYLIQMDGRLEQVARSLEALAQTVALYAKQVIEMREEIHDEVGGLRQELREVRDVRWHLEEKQLQNALAKKEEEANELRSQIKEFEAVRGSTSERIEKIVTERLKEREQVETKETRDFWQDLFKSAARAAAVVVGLALAGAVLIAVLPVARDFIDRLLKAFGG